MRSASKKPGPAQIILLVVTAWRTTVAVGRIEEARQRAQQERDELLVRDRERAERADRAKDEFIAALSHELRTPINAIAGWAQMLRKEDIPDSSRSKALDAVSRNAEVLTRLIDDLLDTSRITTGHLELATAAVDVNAVVHAAVESVLPMAEAKRVRVTATAEQATSIVLGDAHASSRCCGICYRTQ
jgi:signal transduction histidine kinase